MARSRPAMTSIFVWLKAAKVLTRAPFRDTGEELMVLNFRGEVLGLKRLLSQFHDRQAYKADDDDDQHPK